MTTRYVARGPEDLIAVVPSLLHFHPQESVVVMTFGGRGRAFHARVDLPRRPRAQDDVATIVLRAMKSNHLRECVVLLYSSDHAVAAAQGRKLNRKLRRAGIRVVDVVTVDGDRYYRVLAGDEKGTAFDISDHPATLDRILDGVVVHDSRDELSASLAPDPQALADRDAIIEAVQRWLAQGHDATAEAEWIHQGIDQVTSAPETNSTALARLLADLVDPDLLDSAWAGISREKASAHVERWRTVVRWAPEAYLDGPASLLAFAAWLNGDGALAWCALDRCSGRAPMTDMLKHLLLSAVPPTLWPGLSAAELSALRGPAA